MKKCDECKYCVLEDFGYSNYTVEGVTAICLKDENPGLPKDRWYGEEPVLDFAEECKSFEAGQPVEIDCDREECGYGDKARPIHLAYSNDPEIQALLEKQYG